MSPRSGGLWQGGGAAGGIILPGGAAPPLVCSYTAPHGPSTNSSVDVFGAYITGPGAYAYSATPPAAVVTHSPAAIPYGTLNVAPRFGLNSGVYSGGEITEARWSIDMAGLAVGIPTICTAENFPSTWSGVALEFSDDGVSWTVAVALDGSAQAIANERHRYWSLHFGPEIRSAGFWPGIDMQGLLLWGAF